MNSAVDEARRHFSEGVEHFESGRMEAARVAFEAALALAPGRPSVLGNLGTTLFHLGRIDQALPLLKQATAADPANTDAWICLGYAHETQGRWQEAADAMDRAAALAPQRAQLRFVQGQCLMRLGQFEPALRCFDQAVRTAPSYADAWSARGSLLRQLQRFDEAAECFDKALACGGDAELNAYYLASVRNGESVPPPPRRYVEGLFDDYAADFQEHVVGQLRYQGHRQLLQPLIDAGRRYRRVLDLGCGTGLCAPLIKPLAQVLDGVDISAAMLEQAGRLGMYRELAHADIAAYLESATEAADLILAADVFIYVGALENIFRSVRRLLAPDGCFAFTVEAAADDADLRLLPTLRYAHSENYIRRVAVASGLRVENFFRAPIRHDQSRLLEGMYFYLRTEKSAAQ